MLYESCDNDVCVVTAAVTLGRCCPQEPFQDLDTDAKNRYSLSFTNSATYDAKSACSAARLFIELSVPSELFLFG